MIHVIYGLDYFKDAKGPFQRHVCDPKKGESFTFEWLQLLVQTYYQQVFD